MAIRGPHGTVQGSGPQGAAAPAAWEAWGGAATDTQASRSGGEPERPMALERGALGHESASTQAHILDTAERHFAEHGFDGVTMRNIAMDAGLRNQASLYHHFRDKRALYEATLARGVEPMIALLAQSGQLTPPPSAGASVRRHAVENIVDRLLDYLSDHPHLPRLIQRAALDNSHHLYDAIPHLLVPLYAAGLRALAGSSAHWEANDLPHVAFGIYHLIFGYFANAPLLNVLLPTEPHDVDGATRQRRFVKAAVVQLLGVGPES